MNEISDDQNRQLAGRLLGAWKSGRSKTQLELETWGSSDAGRAFDAFVTRWLGLADPRRPSSGDRIERLEARLRQFGIPPDGDDALWTWESQLFHARESMLEAIRCWNDPVSRFRSSTFSLLGVTAWNALAIALLMRDGRCWWDSPDAAFDQAGETDPIEPKSLGTRELLALAFGTASSAALRANVQFWIELRNRVAHRRIPALDLRVAPEAQALLLNFEIILINEFGPEWALGDQMWIALQLAGFRDAGALESVRRAQAALPVDVQILLDRRWTDLADEIRHDPAYALRVLFVPVVPNSGRGAEAEVSFVPPGTVSPERQRASVSLP
jgi:hypothetical protein